MFVITKSGLVIRPEGLDLSIAHTRHFINYLSGLLAEFHEEAARARTIAPEGIPQEDSIIADTQRELSRAEAHISNLEEAKGHVTHVYDRNFQDWAEAFRQVRIQLGLETIEDSPHLYALLKLVRGMLKRENHWFSENKFIKHINNGGQATYDHVKLDKRVYEPMVFANPTSRYSAQVRVNGWAQDEAFFDTKEEAQMWLDNYKYDGQIGEGVMKDYQAVFKKWADPFK
jgi:hypothetical protein